MCVSDLCSLLSILYSRRSISISFFRLSSVFYFHNFPYSFFTLLSRLSTPRFLSFLLCIILRAISRSNLSTLNDIATRYFSQRIVIERKEQEKSSNSFIYMFGKLDSNMCIQYTVYSTLYTVHCTQHNILIFSPDIHSRLLHEVYFSYSRFLVFSFPSVSFYSFLSLFFYPCSFRRM